MPTIFETAQLLHQAIQPENPRAQYLQVEGAAAGIPTAAVLDVLQRIVNEPV